MADIKELGIALKAYRVAAGESVSELADATELGSDKIKQIEAGLITPDTSDIEMLARHFSLREQEIKRLLKLSGQESQELNINLDDDIDLEKLTSDVDTLFAPVFYTDMVNVASNQYGITINFIQNSSGSDKPIVVSRVGMSHQHAESIIEVLKETIKRANQAKEKESKSETED